MTNQKWTVDALRRSEEEFRRIFKLSPVGIGLYDANGHLIDMNQACLDIFGVSDRQEILGLNLFEDPNLTGEMKTKLLEGEVIRFERELDFDLVRKKSLYPTSKTGKLFLDVVISSQSLKPSTPTGFLLEVQDISTRRRMDEELLRSKKLEATGLIASGIAHDLNNLLSIILTDINIARLDLPLRHSPIILESAENAVLRAKDLMNKFIIFAGANAPLKRTMGLRKLLEDSAILALSGSNVEQACLFSDDLWPVTISEGQIRQAITNVIVNARESMPEGGIVHICARNTDITMTDKELFPVLKEGRYVKISIEDQGVGIPVNHLERIFDPYFSTKNKGSEKGMGFGLAITLSVIKKHGGHVDVKSEMAVGTTVNLYLPASPPNHRGATSQDGEVAPMRKRILLMDDEEMLLVSTKLLLQRMGHEVEVVRNGEEAIRVYLESYEHQRPFDLVILDLTVKGGMGGRETVTILRKIDPHVKAVVSSGYSEEPIVANFRQYGFDDALAKPYTCKQLQDLLSNVAT